MRSSIWLVAGTILVTLAVASFAAEGDAENEMSGIAVGGKIGTTGLGVDLTLKVTDAVNLRGGFSTLQISHDDTYDDVDYDLDVDFQFVSVLVDIHPFENNFRITAGAAINNSDVTMNGVVSASETIGNGVYSATAIGTLTGVLTFDDLVPYVGIGFGNAVGNDGRWTFLFDIGVFIQSYDVTLSANGTASSDAGFAADLTLEAQDIQDELDNIEIYPVLAFGVACRL